MHYKFFSNNPNSHYLDIEVLITNINSHEVIIQIPAWRPGRYELGNFAKNVKGFKVFDSKNNPISFIKMNKDAWKVNTSGLKDLKVTYSYYANDLNAGSTYVSESQMYVNPVNCCVFVKEKMNEPHTIELLVPENYTFAGSLNPIRKNKYAAADFDELADSPFFASASIQSKTFLWENVNYHLHFNGECLPEWGKLEKDFKKFVKECVDFFGGIHVKDYHFLFQILPFRFYHGVEHVKSTVIALGPSYAVMSSAMYNELLGVSCHEIFHTWNIKTIRPVEMLPYDFTKENYARTGFVYEGITTYYGDKLLYTSEVFSQEEYFHTLEERLMKHFHNGGRNNLSLADSSFDTWLDGYVPGAPNRKVSIYDEGNLVAFMLDLRIMNFSNLKYSLKDVMRELYHEYYKKGKGYAEEDIIAISSRFAERDLKKFFEDYVYDTCEYEEELKACFNLLGWELNKEASFKSFERLLGIKLLDVNGVMKIASIAADSSFNSVLQINDEIISINNNQIKGDLHHWLLYHAAKSNHVTLVVVQNAELREVTIVLDPNANYYPVYKIAAIEKVSAQQSAMHARWMDC